jgi:hypothetical protein
MALRQRMVASERARPERRIKKPRSFLISFACLRKKEEKAFIYCHQRTQIVGARSSRAQYKKAAKHPCFPCVSAAQRGKGSFTLLFIALVTSALHRGYL